MFVAASTRCFWNRPFEEACGQLTDLEYDKVELWLNEEENGHPKPADLAADPERFVTDYRNMTRLTPIALCLEQDVPDKVFQGLIRTAKLLRIMQITVPSAPLGTPFNTEIDRLRHLTSSAFEDGIRISIKTSIGSLAEDPQTAVELCQSVKGLGLTLDPSCYIYKHEKPLDFDFVYPHVFHTHLRDTTPETLQVPVGLGELDHSRMIALLEKQNYQRALSVELLPDESTHDARSLELRKIRMLLETLL